MMAKSKYEVLHITDFSSFAKEIKEVDVEDMIWSYTHKQCELIQNHELAGGVHVLLFCSGETQVFVPVKDRAGACVGGCGYTGIVGEVCPSCGHNIEDF